MENIKLMEVIIMTKIMNANTLENYTNNQINLMVANNYKGRLPKVVILMASNDKPSERYVANKIKMAEKFNIEAELIKFNENVTNKDLEEVINDLNNDESVDGLILQLPVYEHLNAKRLINQICPYKDVDGLTWYSKALLENNELKLMPCTPLGVKNLLLLEGVIIAGKNVVVVGRGETSGAPMATTFRNLDATVTFCHSKTSRKDLEFYVRHADIVISCVGKQNILDAEWFKEGSIVVGVGFTYDENGKQQLDFDFNKVVELGKAKLVSQRTNCTGKATVISLLYNTVLAYLGNL
jgi:methylenetetrahydrofolate dehydrogenase (NADP+)/methenyltetrahydrofolate cyclohydrolase